MPSIRSRLAVFVLLLSLLTVFVATPTASRPPPKPLCGACGNGFTEEVHRYGKNHGIEYETASISAAHSTATIRVRDNGTATWTVRNELASEDAAQFFRNNPTAFDDIAEYAGPDSGTLISARLTGTKTVVLRYRTPSLVSTTPGGVVRFDGFRNVHGGAISGLGADKVTVVGPPGTVVTRGPSEAQMHGNSFTLTSYHESGDGPFVTFAGSGGVAGKALSFVAVAQALAGIVILNLFFIVLVPCLLLFAVLFGFARISSEAVKRSEETFGKMAKIVGVLGVLGLAVGLAMGTPGGLRTWLVFPITGGAYLSLAFLSLTSPRLTLPRVVAGTLTAWITGVAVTILIAASLDSYFFSRLLEGNHYAVAFFIFAALVSLLLLSLVVVGYVVTEGRYQYAAIALPTIALAVVLLASNTLTQVWSFMGIIIFSIVGVILLILLVLTGFPAFLLGRTIPKEESG